MINQQENPYKKVAKELIPNYLKFRAVRLVQLKDDPDKLTKIKLEWQYLDLLYKKKLDDQYYQEIEAYKQQLKKWEQKYGQEQIDKYHKKFSDQSYGGKSYASMKQKNIGQSQNINLFAKNNMFNNKQNQNIFSNKQNNNIFINTSDATPTTPQPNKSSNLAKKIPPSTNPFNPQITNPSYSSYQNKLLTEIISQKLAQCQDQMHKKNTVELLDIIDKEFKQSQLDNLKVKYMKKIRMIQKIKQTRKKENQIKMMNNKDDEENWSDCDSDDEQ